MRNTIPGKVAVGASRREDPPVGEPPQGPAGTAGSGGRGKSGAPRTHWWQRRKALPYLLIAPAVLFELVVHIIPMIIGAVISLFKLTKYYLRNWAGAPFAGIGNYVQGVDPSKPAGSAFWSSFGVTLLYTVIVVAVAWAIGTVAAICLNIEFRGRRWLRALFLLPYALPLYVGVIVWRFMFQKDGAINTFLADNLHLLSDKPFWLVGSNAFWAMVVTSIWRWWPFAFLIVLAGLQNIPNELYEAASIDGASAWRRFRSITLPQLKSVNLVLVLVLFLWNFNDFNVPFVLFGKTPPESADVLSVFIYSNAFDNWNFGLGSAMSVVMLAALMIVAGIYMWVLRRGGDNRA